MKSIGLLFTLFLVLANTSLFCQNQNPDELCGPDDRISASHMAVGRIYMSPEAVGTGWILYDGRIVTARHVIEGKTSGFIEFNVPNSISCNELGYPSSENRYTIIMSSIVKSSSTDMGNDWAIFSVNPSSNKTPLQRQNAYFYVEKTTSPGALELYGFGQSNIPAYCLASQKSTGNYQGLNGTIIEHDLDTKDGCSGAPIINTITGKVIGIHTHPGCPSGNNKGTSTYNTALWSALNPSFNFTVHQKNNSGAELTSTNIGRWIGPQNNGSFQDYVVTPNGALIDQVIYGNFETFRGWQDKTSSPPYEKFNNWTGYNDVSNFQKFLIEYPMNVLTSQFDLTLGGISIKNEFPEVSGFNPTNDMVEFRDPWLIDYNDPNYNGTPYRNRGMSAAIFKSRSAPFYPDYSTPYGTDQYLGTFLNQEYDPQGNNPYYSVRSPMQQPQSIYVSQAAGYHKFYFYNWSSTGTDPLIQNNLVNGYYESPVVFRSGSATVTANLKGQGLSENKYAFDNNNQRKIVRSTNGNLHMVYESMNHIWYERKTVEGDWELMNGGKPLDRSNGAAWNPSIDFMPYEGGGNDVVIISFVEERLLPPYGFNIMVQVYAQGNYQYEASASNENLLISPESTPIIALGNQTFVVSWTYGSSFCYRLGQIGNQIYWDDTDVRFIIAGGDAVKSHPTIATDHNYVGQLDKYRLAWDQNGSIIRGISLQVFLTNTTPPYNVYETEGYAFSQAGFTSNYEPSISVMPNSDYRLSWIGENSISKTKRVVTWFNNQFYIFGTSITSHSTSATSDGRNIIAYGDYNGSLNKFAHIWYYTYYQNLNTIGSQTHLTNGSGLSDMYAMTFQNNTSPYSFSLSQNLGSLSKINNANISSGREALVTGDSAQFYFTLGDVTLDGDIINYIATGLNPDFSSIDTLNYYLKTEPFTLKNSSQFSFSIEYGVTDSLKAATEFGENDYVKFKLQLVNAINGQLLGGYTVVTFNKANITPYFGETFTVNTNGIGNKNVILKILTEENINGTYDMANINADGSILPKKNVKDIVYTGAGIIKEYALRQNFPNPFNPTTTINYQLPENGFVTLKIYDILGKEVATLVNEQKTQGIYTVNFNAPDLASGVYIYQLRVNDYVNSKKMLLLK